MSKACDLFILFDMKILYFAENIPVTFKSFFSVIFNCKYLVNYKKSSKFHNLCKKLIKTFKKC